MPRPLRIEYEGAMYHVMSRGDRREDIFLDDQDRRSFLRALGETCAKTGWEIHAYVLMSNHFHLVVETPQPNLSLGMKWMLGTYTQRWNRRWRRWGHLFGGRYKAQNIDERSPGYIRAACDYVHLNPERAHLLPVEEPLESYAWSSYPAYLKAKLRPTWLCTDRLLGEHGKETARHHLRLFAKGMELQRQEARAPAAENVFASGWRIGAEDFAGWLSEKLGRRGAPSERARERRETDEQLAERLVREGLAVVAWKDEDLRVTPKGDPVKVELARLLRQQTPMTRAWIARRLHMGSASYVSALLSVNSKN
jgi:REP element-mobilizing transposase RayT